MDIYSLLEIELINTLIWYNYCLADKGYLTT